MFFSVIIAAMYLTSDRTAPVITVDESKVRPYSAEQGEEVLKSYAKAVDAKDGDEVLLWKSARKTYKISGKQAN